MWHYVGGTPGRRFLCLFRRKTKQRPELEISDKTGSGGGKASLREARGSVGKGTQRGSVGKGTQLAKEDAKRLSTMEERGERSALSGLSRECQSQQKSDRRLLKPDEPHRGCVTNAIRCQHCWCLFVEVSRKIHASVSLQMHGECSVTKLPFLCLKPI